MGVCLHNSLPYFLKWVLSVNPELTENRLLSTRDLSLSNLCKCWFILPFLVGVAGRLIEAPAPHLSQEVLRLNLLTWENETQNCCRSEEFSLFPGTYNSGKHCRPSHGGQNKKIATIRWLVSAGEPGGRIICVNHI